MGNLSFNIFQVAILLGSVNGITWAVLIFRQRKKNKSNIYLGFLVLVFALSSIKIVLQEKIPGFNRLLPFPLLYQFAIGPLLLFYIKAFVTGDSGLKARQLLHFIPSVLFDVCPALLLFSCGFSNATAQIQKLVFLSDVLALFFFAFYWRASWLFIRQQKEVNRQWTDKILLISSTILITWLLYIVSVFGFKGNWLWGIMPYYPVYLVLGFCMYGVGIVGYYRPEIGLLKMPQEKRRPPVQPDELTLKKAMVLSKINENAWYRDEDISLQVLSRHLQMPVNELSHIINAGFEMNFSDFINTLRVEELKRKLADPLNKKFTMLGLAFEVGFNSKASFYRAFKKLTNKTPSEFYKDLQDSA